MESRLKRMKVLDLIIVLYNEGLIGFYPYHLGVFWFTPYGKKNLEIVRCKIKILWFTPHNQPSASEWINLMMWRADTIFFLISTWHNLKNKLKNKKIFLF